MSGTDQNQRYIRHELTWEPTALVSYTVDSTFETTLILNDSNDSKFGPGIFLDMGTTFYSGNLPEKYFNHYGPLLAPYQKFFIGGSTAPEQLLPNHLYTISFISTKPGRAAQDNAELTISFSNEECWLFCSSGAYCHIHDGLFSLEPIPGRIDWQPNAERCGEWQPIWIPWVSAAQ